MLSPEETRLLDRLALAPGGLAPTAAGAARRHVHVRGHGLEFHDFREYQPGDDPRTIDWTIHARLRQLVVRTTRSEGQLRVHLLIDVSPSMSAGEPAKAAMAGRIGAALAYLAVRQREAVGVATFDSRVRTCVPPSVGHGQLFRVLSAIDAISGGGRSDLNAALTGYGSIVRGPGLVVILSDFLDAAGSLDGIRFLRHRGLQPALVHIADDQETEPPAGDEELELFDIENPTAAPLVVGPDAVAAYRARVGRWRDALAASCRELGVPWIPVRTVTPLHAVMTLCQQAHLVVGQG